jgi:hypothetical protein
VQLPASCCMKSQRDPVACTLQVFLQDEKLKWWHVRDRSRHEHWLRKFFGQPCNGELFVKQSINMAGGLQSVACIEFRTPASTEQLFFHKCMSIHLMTPVQM